jgi:hypothetical protein
MHGRVLLGLLPLAPTFLLIGACGREAARIGMVMRSPQGVLDEATSVELSVFPASQAQCLADGQVTSIPSGDSTQTFTLEKCDGGWCKEIELDQGDTQTMFAIVARGALGPVAHGCTTAVIDQDPLEVDIQVFKFNPPKCCNDGVLQAGEQCDGGEVAATDCSGMPATGGQCRGVPSDAVCECDCLGKEIPVDRRADVVANPPLTRIQPSMTFAGGEGELANGLRVAFTNTEGDNEKDVQVRAFRADLYPIINPPLLGDPLSIPLLCTSPLGNGGTRSQHSPSIASVTTTSTALVYLNDEELGGFFDVFISDQNDSGCADAAPRKVNATDKRCSAPDVARGPEETALIVWTTSDNVVLARIWDRGNPAAPFIPAAADIEVATNGSLARVAGSADGWAVAYQGGGPDDGDGIFLVRVGAEGTVQAPAKVNAVTDGLQDQPDVAMLEDGRAIVTWRSGGDVYFQRFGADGEVDQQDQASAIHAATDGEQGSAAVAASVGFGEFFAVAWEETGPGSVRARFVGGSTGFLFNSVTGQNDDFLASHPMPGLAGNRRAPAVAIGGGGFVAIGWHDEAIARSGIFVRRFPLPQ